ncbi:hypothetical protein [Helicobacter sp. 23-1046]
MPKTQPLLQFFNAIAMSLSLALSSLSATSTENYSKWLARIGGEVDYIRHSTEGMWMHGVGTSWIIQTAYIKKQVKLELDLQFGRSPMDIHGSYATFAVDTSPIKNEPRFNRFSGASTLYLNAAFKVGWNILDSIEDPLYINLGYNTGDVFLHYSRGYPIIFAQQSVALFIEAEGKKSINDTFAISYLGRIGYLGAITQVQGSDDIQQKDVVNLEPLNNEAGFEAWASVGFTYALSKKVSFFTRLNAKYLHLPATRSAQLTTITNSYPNGDPLDTGIVSNQTFNVAYPKTYRLFAGISLGFEF